MSVAALPFNESLLYTVLKDVFPSTTIEQNARKNINIQYPSTGGYMEFDIWLPEHDLCFEFQDPHHYTTTWYYQATQTEIRRRDNIKREKAQQNGFTLILVPYWWDGSPSRLISSILFQRPEINLQEDANESAIQLNPPRSFAGGIVIPQVGEFMLASLPDTSFNSQLVDFSWWIGEKYDGVRCCWNPLHRKLYLRSGKDFSLKPKMLTSLPPIFVDSEIWFGRGSFSDTYSLNYVELCDWSMLRMIAFDVPLYADQNTVYEERYAKLLAHAVPYHPFNIVTTRMSFIFGTQSWLVQCVIDHEGEGIILQQAASLYIPGRSTSLIKLKTTAGEQEAIVVSIGRRRAITLQLPSGTTFIVPPTNVLIELPTPGDLVTFSYEAFARRDVPVNPTIFRLRTDLSWEDLVERATRTKRYLNETSQLPDEPAILQGRWTLRTMRQYMENFARGRKMDPLQPKTWQDSFRLFISSINGKAILRRFKHGYFQALYELFPEVKFDPSFFRQSYYRVENRRTFFDNYARKHKFNPLKPENWYDQPKDSIMSTQGAARVISYHKNSIIQALIDLFPDIPFDRMQFQYRQNIWHKPDTRRQFFYDYAKEYGFSPLQLSNWYAQPLERIRAKKGADRVLSYHKNRISTALFDLFPNMELDVKAKGVKANSIPTLSVAQRRQFFINFARDNDFDPFIPEHWQATPISKILGTEGVANVIYYHNQSVSKALVDLFPDIGLDLEKFRQTSWNSIDNRRKFMEKYAKKQGFNPLIPENWYNHPIKKIMGQKGIDRVLFYHKHSLATALMELFPGIGLERTKFKFRQYLWSNKENRRRFLETFARSRKFDPLIPDQWYDVSINRIYAMKGGSRVLFYHGNSLTQALLDLFPEIGLDESKFKGK